MDKKRLEKQVAVAKKYKIDPEPYLKVEYYLPRTGKHEIVEFGGDDSIGGVTWYDSNKVRTPALNWFIAGMLWGTVISWIAMIVRGL